MTSNAPGQLLGFTLQYPRALYHLLKSGPGDLVCIEHLGDVATLKSNFDIIAEEDKSSIVDNRLTDRSTDLWKTFSNWIKIINDNKLDIKQMKFLLYCNHSGRDGIVNRFNSAQNQQDAQDAVNYAKKELSDINLGHDIWKYYDFVINQNETLLLEIIKRFELQIGSGTGHEEVRREIRCKIIPESQVEDLMHKLSGWLVEEISKKILSREPAIISWEQFSHKFVVPFECIRNRELIDFASQSPCRDEYLQNILRIYPIYLQQLGVIKASEYDLLEAVSDYISADTNRQKWIENGTIDEDAALDFERKLKTFWRSKARSIEIVYRNVSEEDRGQLLLSECKSRQETIRGMPTPCSTIAGTYHTLADGLDIGWHPSWEKIFPTQEEE